MEPTRDDIKAWLHSLLAKTGDTPSSLARKAGLATTTLTRFLNDPAAPMLKLRSIAKIAHVSGVPPIGVPNTSPPAGFAEAEAEPLRPADDIIARVVEVLIRGRNAADPWRLTTRALTGAGYLPGDILIVDLNQAPKPGDIVCAQAYRWVEGKAETVFRIFAALRSKRTNRGGKNWRI